MPADRLYATYFEGNDAVPEDTVSRDIWLRLLPPERVLKGNSKDNFWEMGDQVGSLQHGPFTRGRAMNA